MNENEQRAGAGVLLEEQETCISFSRTDNDCIVWTSDSTTMTKLNKLCEIAPEVYRVRAVGYYKGKIVHKEYVISDKTLISFRTKKTTRELTEEQKQKRKDILLRNRGMLQFLTDKTITLENYK